MRFLSKTTKFYIIVSAVLAMLHGVAFAEINSDSIRIDSLFEVIYENSQSAPLEELSGITLELEHLLHESGRIDKLYNVYIWRLYISNRYEDEVIKKDQLLALDSIIQFLSDKEISVNLHSLREVDMGLRWANYYKKKANYKLALSSLNRSLEYISKCRDQVQLYERYYKTIYIQIGQICTLLGRDNEALKIYGHLIDFEKRRSVKTGRTPSYYSIQGRMALLYQGKYDFIKSLDYSEQYLDYLFQETLRKPYLKSAYKIHIGRTIINIIEALNALNLIGRRDENILMYANYSDPSNDYKFYCLLSSYSYTSDNKIGLLQKAKSSLVEDNRVSSLFVSNRIVDYYLRINNNEQALCELQNGRDIINRIRDDGGGLGNLNVTYLEEYTRFLRNALVLSDDSDFEKEIFIRNAIEEAEQLNISSLIQNDQLISSKYIKEILDIGIDFSLSQDQLEKAWTLMDISKSITLREIMEYGVKNKNLLPRVVNLESNFFNLMIQSESESDIDILEGERSTIFPKEQTIVQYHIGYKEIIALVLEDGIIRKVNLGSKKDIVIFVSDFVIGIGKMLPMLNSYKLYSILIESLGLNHDEIIIVAEGELLSLPFEALTTNPSDPQSYLFKSTNITYQLSTNIHKALKKRNYKNKGIASISPVFKDDPSRSYASRGDQAGNMNLYRLINSEIEIEKINEIWESPFRAPTKESATSAFVEKSIFHFSGHAISGSVPSDESYLAFSSDVSQGANVISLNELYQLECNNDLVVLSACNTGVGQLAKGEGALSLARGFFYAGAKSVVSTLWAVNDKSSSMIMIDFHKNLKKGEAKDVALRNAKLSYLEKADPEYQHPYYWAGFIAMGDMSPLVETGWSYWNYVFVGLGLFVVIGVVVKKKLFKL